MITAQTHPLETSAQHVSCSPCALAQWSQACGHNLAGKRQCPFWWQAILDTLPRPRWCPLKPEIFACKSQAHGYVQQRQQALRNRCGHESKFCLLRGRQLNKWFNLYKSCLYNGNDNEREENELVWLSWDGEDDDSWSVAWFRDIPMLRDYCENYWK